MPILQSPSSEMQCNYHHSVGAILRFWEFKDRSKGRAAFQRLEFCTYQVARYSTSFLGRCSRKAMLLEMRGRHLWRSNFAPLLCKYERLTFWQHDVTSSSVNPFCSWEEKLCRTSQHLRGLQVVLVYALVQMILDCGTCTQRVYFQEGDGFPILVSFWAVKCKAGMNNAQDCTYTISQWGLFFLTKWRSLLHA